VNSRATLPFSLCSCSARESSGFGEQLPRQVERGDGFQPGLLLSSCGVEGSHRWDAKRVGKSVTKASGRQKHCKERGFSRWVVCFLSSALAD